MNENHVVLLILISLVIGLLAGQQEGLDRGRNVALEEYKQLSENFTAINITNGTLQNVNIIVNGYFGSAIAVTGINYNTKISDCTIYLKERKPNNRSVAIKVG